jgi:hypothetical protein
MDATTPFNIDALRLERTPASAIRCAAPHHAPGEHFLKGPVPLAWLNRASRLPGKALAVALAIWYVAGMEKSGTVRLTRSALMAFNVGRKAAYRALAALERAGLVQVERKRGSCTKVTITHRRTQATTS